MNKTLLALTMAAATFGAIQTANACSYATFEMDGNAFVARSMEAPDFMQEHLVTVPQGYAINGKSGDVGFVGMRHGDTEWISSGLNEHGVNVESLALVESKYAAEGEGDVNYLEVTGFTLANAKSVDEAVKILKKTKVETTKIAVAHDLEIGMHFAIRDAKRAIVVEYVDDSGYPTIYENDLGTMTNDPAYPVQVELAEAAIKEVNARTSETLDTFDKRDSGPDGRFTRVATVLAAMDQNPKAGDIRDNGVARAFALLNDMEIVPGTMYWEWVSPDPQMVGYGNVVDIANKDYYFRTADNQQIRKVDLDNIDFSTVKYTSTTIYGIEPAFQDVTVTQ
ncbi:linear amide C-N hydrolase [Vibrio sp. 10N.261.51.F12]|uniref:linear amide C-N hydrolase n=1 Tax=Vibrio sp. 10N.261.51.F12 TaxID=3229679 RepID=UPI003552110C